MSSQAFHFEIKGDGIEPESIPLRDLIRLLDHLDAALVVNAKAQGLDESEIDFTLAQLKKGNSSDHEIKGSAKAIASVDRLTRGIANPDRFRTLSPRVRENVRWMWQWAYDFGCEALAFNPNGSQITPAAISVEQEIPGEHLTYRGRTTIYGVCTRAGGDRYRSATIKFPNGKTKAVRLKTQALAQELGRRLYQTVGLTGEATWDAETRELVLFQVEKLAPFRDREPGARSPRTIVESLQDLAKAAGGRWDNVDPEEFVRELRRD